MVSVKKSFLSLLMVVGEAKSTSCLKYRNFLEWWHVRKYTYGNKIVNISGSVGTHCPTLVLTALLYC